MSQDSLLLRMYGLRGGSGQVTIAHKETALQEDICLLVILMWH